MGQDDQLCDQIAEAKEGLARLDLDGKQAEQLFYGVGRLLQKYRSGVLPQALRALGQLPAWEKLLDLARPAEWSAQAMHAVARTFASTLEGDQAALFYERHLLPAVRLDISKSRKLDYHLYEALKCAVLKGNAWLKGIMFPLCQDGTHREVYLVCTLLKKVTFPTLSAAAGLIKLSEMPFSHAAISFIKTLLEKRYSFPERVVHTLTDYWQSFRASAELPVIWHQTLLSFCEFYKASINEMAKAALKELALTRSHHLITKEIIRHLS